jgi:hypothetical protein
METKNKVLATLCLLAAIILGGISSILTGAFFYSTSEGPFGWVMVMVGVCLDFGKFAFPALAAFSYNKEKFISLFAYSLLTIACVLTSFFASMAFDLNANNAIKNETVTNSDAYKRQNALFNTTNTSIEKLRKDIANMKANKNIEVAAAVEGLKSQKNSLPKDYVTRKNQLQSQIDNKEAITKSKIEQDIKEKENELKLKENKLPAVQEGFSTVGKDISPTKGAYALAQWMSAANPDGTIGIMNLIKNILIELVAIAFSMAFGSLMGKIKQEEKHIDEIQHTQHTHQETYMPQQMHSNQQDVVILKAGEMTTNNTNTNVGKHTFREYDPITNNEIREKKIGFVHEPSNLATELLNNPKLNKELVKKYFDWMIKNKIGENISRGYKVIADGIEIDYETARKIKGYLEQEGILEVVGNRTIIKNTSSL